MKESTLQRNCIAYLRECGAYVFKVVGSAMQQRGTADILVCYRSKFIAVEFKAPGKTTSKLQDLELAKVEKAGGISVIISNMEELERLINGI